MKARFARLQDRLHRACADRLSDSVGDFSSPGRPPVCGLPLMVDRNLQFAEGGAPFVSGAVGISFYRKDLATAARGDIFTIGSERFQVEQLIADDGHMITAATMVQT